MAVPGFVRRIIKSFPSIIQAVALVALFHLLSQGLIGKFGGARYRFSKNQYGNFGSDKVQKVIKYIDKNIPKYQPNQNHVKGKGKKTTPTPRSTTSTTPPPPPPLADLQEEQQRRVQGLHDTCNRLQLEKAENSELTELEDFLRRESLPTKPTWQNLLCSKEHNLTYCPLYKSASTFLLKKFLLISPKEKYDKESVKRLEVQANILARKAFGYLDSWDQYPQFTKEGTTFLFVRHPFERLLSAFRDKLEDPSVQGKRFNEYYYNKYGRRIVMHFRKEKITGPSFKYPRFHEFLEFLLSRDLRYYDEHWAPYFIGCSPCHVPYNFIGHFETLYWDMHLLANKTNLVGKWDDPNDYFQSSTYLEVSKKYFSLVDRDIIRKIHKKYKLDFDMFGYTPDEYIAMGKPGPDEVEETSLKPVEEESGNGSDQASEQNEIVNPSPSDSSDSSPSDANKQDPQS